MGTQAASKPVPTSIEGPSIEIAGVKVFAERDGDHVTGRVVLPGARQSIPIDYRAQRSTGEIPDPKSAMRLAAVTDYKERIKRNEPKTASVRAVAKKYGCAPRSVQLWVKRHELGGVDALRDEYAGLAPKLLVLATETARSAVTFAAWWAHRIGNIERIDNQVMDAAAKVVSRYPIGDVLAAVEAYFGWPCDRVNKYPFRAFARWCRYGDDVARWIARGKELGTETPLWKVRAASRTRARDVFNLRTRADLNRLPSDDDAESIDNALGSLPDEYCSMLTRAAYGDMDAKREAASTFDVWWPKMPESLRNWMNDLQSSRPMTPVRTFQTVLHHIRVGLRPARSSRTGATT